MSAPKGDEMMFDMDVEGGGSPGGPSIGDARDRFDRDESMQDLTQSESSPYSSKPINEAIPPGVEPDLSAIPSLKRPVIELLFMHKCYEAMPTSAKVVVLDTELPVKDAFHVAHEHGIIFATLWNSEEKHFEGMLTITDFIDMLLHFHHEPDTITVMKQLEDHRIKTWRALGSRKRPQKLVFISPDHTLLDAVQVLSTNRIHRLPLMHETALLNIMTYEAILEFLHYNIDASVPLLSKTIAELGIGSFREVVTAHPQDTLLMVLDIFTKRSISAVPVVNDENQLVDIYSRSDVMYLAAARKYDLEIPLEEALESRPELEKGICTCVANDTLALVISSLVTNRVHRLIVVNEASQIEGIVSITDIFQFIFKDLWPRTS